MTDADVRVVTFNTAAGNPRIKTPQAAFLQLPFYVEAFDGTPQAPILALQEVGPAQARALKQRALQGGFELLQLSRPGLGNALVVPDRYEVLSTRRGFYARSHLLGVADGLRRWARSRQRPDWRQFGELRIWLLAKLRDRTSGQELTILNTHLSVEPSLKVAQARALVRRARGAGPRVILAADLNVPAANPRGRDLEVTALLAPFSDMGTQAPPGKVNIDYVLTVGFEPVSSRIWSGDALQLPGSPTADLVSDHYAEDDVIRYS